MKKIVYKENADVQTAALQAEYKAQLINLVKGCYDKDIAAKMAKVN